MGMDSEWSPGYVSYNSQTKDSNRNVLTGSYQNYFHIYDVNTAADVVLQADKSAFKAKKIGAATKPGMKNGTKAGAKEGANLDAMDFNKKILHGSWHPRENTIAVSGNTCSVRASQLISALRDVDCGHGKFLFPFAMYFLYLTTLQNNLFIFAVDR